MTRPPQYLIDAARRGDYIDPKDPYVRKMMREAKKEEKQKILDAQQKLFDLHIRALERENEQFEQNNFFNDNTIDWNYNQQCRYCESTSMRIIERPDIKVHYAEYKCNLCDRHNAWIPWSKKCTKN